MSPDTDVILGAEVAVSLLAVAFIAGVLAFVLLRAATKQAEAMVTVALSILTLVAIIGFISTQNEALITLAGAGVGALAGALTNLFGDKPGASRDDHTDR
jgi:hypothetical protein